MLALATVIKEFKNVISVDIKNNGKSLFVDTATHTYVIDHEESVYNLEALNKSDENDIDWVVRNNSIEIVLKNLITLLKEKSKNKIISRA